MYFRLTSKITYFEILRKEKPFGYEKAFDQSFGKAKKTGLLRQKFLILLQTIIKCSAQSSIFLRELW
ncbi:hypothetical protein EGI11_11580 [Chryseobacterium sp. H3056]|uniref:Uncharacterized protein n=1 Tax=Kaistella daneshvariae TaxID=2487074 RepID=A0A3N0WU41_9FLAO|nr:hypothetical protein EGI11_11580 [Kaistella daneshvariae]